MDVAGRIGWVLVIDALLCAAIAFTAANTGERHVDAAWVIATLAAVLGVTGVSLLVLAKVVWVKREGSHFAVGLEFVSLKPEDRERVEAWAHSPSEPGVARLVPLVRYPSFVVK